MKPFFMVPFIVLVFTAPVAFAQRGGKAEPFRIKFAAGKTSTTLTGTLSNEQEMDYVFSARKGQKVTITNAKPALFDFRVFSEGSNLETEYESSPTLTITAPATGDYNFFVRKKRVTRPRTARFSISLSIR